MSKNQEFSRFGGLTLMPTSERFSWPAKILKRILENGEINQPETPTDIAEPEFDYRVNGEPFMKIGSAHLSEHDVYILATGPGTPRMLAELSLAEMYAAGRHASRITVILGYLPLSRSDKDEGEEELALLPHFIHQVYAAAYGKLHRIIACDLHSPQGVMAGGKPALITEVSMIRVLLDTAIQDAIIGQSSAGDVSLDNIVFSFPDEGAVKRFSWATDQIKAKYNIEFPTIICQKTRENSTKTKVHNIFGDIEKIPGALILGIDDEIATCATQIQGAEILKNKHHAQRYWSVAVHGVLCGDAEKNLIASDCPIDRICTTDTIPFEDRGGLFAELVNKDRLRVVTWVFELAKIIYHHHFGKSIRSFR